MLSKRTIIGLVIGSAIIAIGGYSLILHMGTITINENYVIAVGDSTSYTIPAPNHTPQHMEITGDAFDLKLTSPSTGLQIPSSNSEKTMESFKDRIEEPLILDWVHLEDGETRIQIQNTGNSELIITGKLIRSSDPIWFTFDLMVITSGLVIIGFSMGFTLRKPKGF
ncbi:MAG: hypothetical protein CO032_02505 [Nitrosopumilales archaeon CG_4_9_14_0_2_um_filter_34_16]|nr:MAG: hypothetical protein CO032_02505 [Nitrosopumilales archaeon CG_4_9_14_0_2_um_filter_34_16]